MRQWGLLSSGEQPGPEQETGVVTSEKSGRSHGSTSGSSTTRSRVQSGQLCGV